LFYNYVVSLTPTLKGRQNFWRNNNIVYFVTKIHSNHIYCVGGTVEVEGTPIVACQPYSVAVEVAPVPENATK